MYIYICSQVEHIDFYWRMLMICQEKSREDHQLVDKGQHPQSKASQQLTSVKAENVRRPLGVLQGDLVALNGI